MLNRLPVDVNPFRLVEQRKSLTGLLPVSQLSRLADMVLPDSGAVTVSMHFTHSPGGLPMIDGRLAAALLLECQRCMQPMLFRLDHPFHLALSAFPGDVRAEEEGLEVWLVEDERLFIQDVVEDEILLALPLVAKHDQCEPLTVGFDAPAADGPATSPESLDAGGPFARKHPFAVLKDWKKTEK